MIDKSDVIKLFVPYPTISDKLARQRHMYVVESNKYTLFNIQTAKPYLVREKILNNYLVLEVGDETPVRRRSYVGMDTRFVLENVNINDDAKAIRGVSNRIFDKIMRHTDDVKQDVEIDRDKLVSLNNTVSVL